MQSISCRFSLVGIHPRGENPTEPAQCDLQIKLWSSSHHSAIKWHITMTHFQELKSEVFIPPYRSLDKSKICSLARSIVGLFNSSQCHWCLKGCDESAKKHHLLSMEKWGGAKVHNNKTSLWRSKSSEAEIGTNRSRNSPNTWIRPQKKLSHRKRKRRYDPLRHTLDQTEKEQALKAEKNESRLIIRHRRIRRESGFF